jgi:hypothetical protein
VATSWRFRLGNPQVISETLEGEAVIIDLDTGYYYSLDPVGSWIWQAVNAGQTEMAIVTGAVTAFSGPPDEITAHTRAFLDKLEQEGLVAREPAEDAGAAPRLPLTTPAAEQSPFTPPCLTRYEDIKELLLLDPIHEVDEDGWPAPKVERADA